jgi:hypothetical protein
MIRELTKFFGLMWFPGDLLLAEAFPGPFPVPQAVVDRYCITCNNGKGGSLDRLPNRESPSQI